MCPMASGRRCRAGCARRTPGCSPGGGGPWRGGPLACRPGPVPVRGGKPLLSCPCGRLADVDQRECCPQPDVVRRGQRSALACAFRPRAVGGDCSSLTYAWNAGLNPHRLPAPPRLGGCAEGWCSSSGGGALRCTRRHPRRRCSRGVVQLPGRRGAPRRGRSEPACLHHSGTGSFGGWCNFLAGGGAGVVTFVVRLLRIVRTHGRGADAGVDVGGCGRLAAA